MLHVEAPDTVRCLSLVKPSWSLPLVQRFHYSSDKKDAGYVAKLTLFQELMECWESNCNPLSVTTTLGMSCLKNMFLQCCITASAVVQSSFFISINLEE